MFCIYLWRIVYKQHYGGASERVWKLDLERKCVRKNIKEHRNKFWEKKKKERERERELVKIKQNPDNEKRTSDLFWKRLILLFLPEDHARSSFPQNAENK